MARNYDFVYFPREVKTEYVTDINRRNGKYSGNITLKIKAVDNLYLGSGFLHYDGRSGIVAESLFEHGKMVIPGSSVKGAVRHVARAVSDACILSSESERLNLDKKQKYKCNPKISNSRDNSFQLCIVCDMFGAMGIASKVRFSDFVSDSCDTEECSVPVQFSPDINFPYYKINKNNNKFHKGYKFYKTICEEDDVPKTEKITATKKGTEFTGTVSFSGLHEDELQLLMFSLGLSGKKFSHKLGGYRAHGFGTVNFSCLEFSLINKKLSPEDAAEYAKKYTENKHANPESVKQICEIMKYRE